MKRIIASVLALAATLAGATADPFTYTTRDLLLTFRKSGHSDMEVNLGPVDFYKSLSLGSVVDLTSKYNPSTQLLATFGDLNGLSFSVIGTQRGAGASAANTSWMTLKRTDPNTQTTAPNGFTASKSITIQSQISGIAGDGSTTGIKVYASSQPEDPVFNSGSVVDVPSSGASAVNAFSTKYGSTGGLASLVPSPGVENNTGINFSTIGGVVSSDLYEYAPGTAGSAATYLGSFSFNNSGVMTFAAVPEPNLMTAALASLGLFALVHRFRRN